MKNNSPASYIYVVFYAGNPINIRDNPVYVDYKKVAFANPGHAFNLAEKMNHHFNTDKFEVFRFDGGSGERVTEA